jgi:hypothetical protein
MTTCKISQEDIKQKTINCTNPAYRKKYDGSFLYASPVYLLKVSSDVGCFVLWIKNSIVYWFVFKFQRKIL